MITAPNPATTPAAIIDREIFPGAADVLEVEFAAEVVVVPLISWLTTVIDTPVELAQESAERIVAFELNVTSAHYLRLILSSCSIKHARDSRYTAHCQSGQASQPGYLHSGHRQEWFLLGGPFLEYTACHCQFRLMAGK